MSKVKGKCECPHKCHAIVHISALALSTQVSCHCPHKCLDSVHTSVMSLFTQASCHYSHKHHVSFQTSVTSLSKLVFQTSVMSLSKQATSLSKQASRHYPNKRPNPSIDKPYRTWYSSDIKKKRHKTNNNKNWQRCGICQ